MARVMKTRVRRGTVLVEAALVLPLLLLLLFGVIEYGWVMLQQHHITQAARHGARVGVVAGATTAEVQSAVASWMETAGLGGSGYTVSISAPDVALMNLGEALTVSVSLEYVNIAIGIPFVPAPDILEAAVSMAKEGPS